MNSETSLMMTVDMVRLFFSCKSMLAWYWSQSARPPTTVMPMNRFSPMIARILCISLFLNIRPPRGTTHSLYVWEIIGV